MMKRRGFIAVIAGAAFVWPLASAAQQPERMPRIGILVYGGEAEFGRFVHAFSMGMAERGYQDGRNVRFEVRYSDQDLEKLTRNARELAAEKRRRDLGAGLDRRAGRARGHGRQFPSCSRLSRTRCTRASSASLAIPART